MANITYSKSKGRDTEAQTFQILRTNTTALAVGRLIRGSRLLAIMTQGAASDAVTTATISVGTTTAATEFINAASVKTGGAGLGQTVYVGTYAATPVGAKGAGTPPTRSGDVIIYAKYAETGGASTTGGPYVVTLFYTTGETNI